MITKFFLSKIKEYQVNFHYSSVIKSLKQAFFFSGALAAGSLKKKTFFGFGGMCYFSKKLFQLKTAPFIVYNASAGSGKTFTIVKKYLSLLLLEKRQDAYKNILAITFTNKAVEEMKTRVIDSLIAFSETKTPEDKIDLLSAIAADTQLSEAFIKEKSKRILKSIIHNYAAFEISTIDSFTNRILRTFAKDLGLAVNFELEMDVEGISAEAVDRIIAKAGENPTLTKTLVQFALSKADDDKSWNITLDLNKVAKLLPNENNYYPLKRLEEKTLEDFQEFAQKLKKEIKGLEKRVVETAQLFFELMDKHGLETNDFSSGYIPKYFSKIQNKEFSAQFGAKWQVNIADKNLYPGRVSADKKECIDQLQPEIARLFLESKELILQRGFYTEIIKNLPQLSLLNTIQQEVETIKDERNLLLISDFNKKISKSIKDQPTPFIYERLGERYRNYFIDEAQDTSQFQWENLIPLISDPLASLDELGNPGSLTLVGDAKQAIYRWRGGKAEQFMALSQPAGENPFPVEKEVEFLPANYRSAQEIVSFNNSFFEHTSQYLGFEIHQQLFANAKQENTKKAKGYVNISFVEGKNKDERDLEYVEKTLEIIQNLERSGYPKKDICILVRKKKEGIAVADHLSENNIPIISSETLLISKSPKVQFINNLLAFSLNQQDDTLKVDLLYYLHESYPLETEQHAFISEGLAMKGAAFFDYLRKYRFHFNMKTMQRLALYNAVEYVIGSFNMVENSNAYVQFYLDFVLDYTQKNRGGVAGFVAHWKSKEDKLSIVAPEGEDAVQIMTIHKSKGLEFPIVIYPFANEKIDDTKLDDVWIELEPPFNDIPLSYMSASKKLLEYGENAAAEYQYLLLQKELDAMNMLYVACTRPKQQLYIISEWGTEEKKKFQMNSFSHFFIDYLKSLGRWDESIFSYDLGEFTPAENLDGSEEKNEHNTKFIITSSSTHLNMMTKSGALWGSVQEEAIGRGIVLHEIMNFIGTKTDLDEAMEKAIAKGIINVQESVTYRKMLLEIMNHPDLSAYYEKEVISFNEREILCRGNVLRPDRINIEKDASAVIIDYKTGKFLQKHALQVADYAEAVENMGYQVKKKLLVYINDGVYVKIV